MTSDAVLTNTWLKSWVRQSNLMSDHQPMLFHVDKAWRCLQPITHGKTVSEAFQLSKTGTLYWWIWYCNHIFSFKNRKIITEDLTLRSTIQWRLCSAIQSFQNYDINCTKLFCTLDAYILFGMIIMCIYIDMFSHDFFNCHKTLQKRLERAPPVVKV